MVIGEEYRFSTYGSVAVQHPVLGPFSLELEDADVAQWYQSALVKNIGPGNLTSLSVQDSPDGATWTNCNDRTGLMVPLTLGGAGSEGNMSWVFNNNARQFRFVVSQVSLDVVGPPAYNTQNTTVTIKLTQTERSPLGIA